ncbi:retropepsin-like aspartic protease family protein [Stakelama tenebrarum]|uniref:Clan AA aspartic protease n=1 Tax=Stakelama tenebrarum TaxID=2711215 RepID=A0A6G6Y616_9SPHN|nr:retropepsin-like aspartic protease [Sphingosinithalassobacter tenebrarum]QIG80237.1 clan AA aspartic protease [Sphingosinithalassobacter tenebrarum]
MKRAIVILSALVTSTGCEQLPGGANRTVEYRPTESGTVDHALCLLGFTAVPMREVSTGHHLAEATINGQTASFVIDTGANVSVIDNAYAERFGLEPSADVLSRLGARSIAGAGKAQQASIDTFVIGPVTIRQETIVSADLGQMLSALGQATNSDVAGIIGQDVLTEHRAVIDVSRSMLHLIAEDTDPAPVPAVQCSAESNV